MSHASLKLAQKLETLAWNVVRHSAMTSAASDCYKSFTSLCTRSRVVMSWAKSDVKSRVIDVKQR